MISIADIIADAANLVCLLLIFILLVNVIIKNKVIQLVLMLVFALFVLSINCYHGMSLIDLVRGVIGDLSISGLLFLLILGVVHFTGVDIKLFDRTFCMIILFTGLFLYLSAIDIIPIDIYRSGYLPHSLLVVIFLFCVLFLLVNPVFALIWLIALIAYLARLQNSANLWDYLIDPVLWLICMYKFIFSSKV